VQVGIYIFLMYVISAAVPSTTQGRTPVNLSEATRKLNARDCSMQEHAAAAAFVHSYYTHEGARDLQPLQTRMTTDAAPAAIHISVPHDFPVAELSRRDGETNHSYVDRIRRRADEVRDQGSDFREGGSEVRSDYVEAFRRPSNSSTEMGLDPDPLAVGGELLMEVDAPTSAILVIALANGKTGIFRVGSATNALNPGATTGSGRSFVADERKRHARSFLPAAQRQVREQQAAGARMAKYVSDFWKRQAARG
jgi:hypothetical protein